jgi:dienelactone hydrolase
MAHIVLFHSVLGLRPGVKSFAEKLRETGHTVTIHDFYNGETFKDYETGNKKWSAIGIPAILQQAQAACQKLDGDLVFAGFSNGAAVAEFLAATHPKSRGAVLMHGALPLKMLQLQTWPKQVPVQLHYNDKDPFRDAKNDASLKKSVTASGASFEEFLYHGKTHLFTDPDLPDYDETSARLLMDRVLGFLDKV